MNATPYELPPGVIAGSDGKFYARAPLPMSGWEALDDTARSERWFRPSDNYAPQLFQVRPTAANPIQPLPEHTFPLPDGTLACFRRDAAKLREAGAVLLYTASGNPSSDYYDGQYPAEVLRVEFPPTPKTERVPLHKLQGRTLPGEAEAITVVGQRTNGAWWWKAMAGDCGQDMLVDADGTVEVLLTDTER